MKLIYLHQYFRKPSMAGGVRSYEFSKRLAADGHEVVVVTSDGDNVFRGWRIEEIDGFEVHWVSVVYDNKFGYLRRSLAFLRFVGKATFHICLLKSDKLIATSTPLTVAIPAIFYHVFKRKPYVFEVRDVWPEVPISLGIIKNKVLIYCAKLIEVNAYRYAESVIALSPDMKASILKVLPSRGVAVIPNASDVDLFKEEFTPDASVLTRQLQSIRCKHSRIVFYTGTLGLVNNIKSLVELAFLSPSCVAFIIVGDGREKRELEEHAKSKGVLGKNFYFLDAVSKDQLRVVHKYGDLACSTVLPVPALYSNSANKVFDAFASGTPLLINHGGWLKGLIEEKGCGLVINNTPNKEDAKNVYEFLMDESRYSRASSASLLLGEGVFNRENLYSKFKKVIESDEANI